MHKLTGLSLVTNQGAWQAAKVSAAAQHITWGIWGQAYGSTKNQMYGHACGRYHFTLCCAADVGDDTADKQSMAAGSLPSLHVKADVYHLGQYSYKGISDPVDVCQILPASLSERRSRYMDKPDAANGKVVCLKRDDRFHFAAQVPLPNVFHLPLAAEPPLYINMVHANLHSFSGASSSNPQVILA